MATTPTHHSVYITHKDHDLDSLQVLPDSYQWVQPDLFPSLQQHSTPLSDTLPLIDLSLPDAPDLIGEALRTWGSFQIINHGVPLSLIHAAQSSAIDLFALPPPHKLKAARTPGTFPGYGIARINSFFPKRMWSESFTIMGSPLEHFRHLWPHDYSKRCDIMAEYDRELKSLCGRLMWIALSELGITREDINWAGPNEDFKTCNAATQLNFYPACPDPDRAMGLGAHTDTSLLTVLHQNNTRGLQILREGKQWVTVEPVAGALVVQVGDMLQIVSNGLYKSPFHQAVVNRTKKRLSVAYLFVPPENVEMSPHKKLLSPTQPPLYRPISWTDFIRIKSDHFDGLSCIRVDVKDESQVKVG
ncbi:gibberellin 3-beta-dioxygenase 1-like [Cucurbita pepo subsp. pepo]|uniref:gibberellin 3-beta-dioxygenase 1-like n=1 Tax=Cucurbita pepo subsp. pepo TaxID=3664 RepID=UPI000C9D48D9|nr:gibberellin 3-beta-dioxygenase 1-like [Cucurbita pepo subsp. pepo]